ncbi:hypothetical protein IWQ61_008820 [Dispira simplex]|nr:hypothetical protein IWQ61_008820 [Dispira simplex]
MATSEPTTLCDWCVKILCTPDPVEKVTLTKRLGELWNTGVITTIGQAQPPSQPARPDNLEFVVPSRAPRRGKAGSLQSRIAILHALANIEQWAIDTALDNIVRFRTCAPNESTDMDNYGPVMPQEFFSDFIRMAADEAKHYGWLTDRLHQLGSHFGALPVHAGIWESASETAHDVACRMAIVHMVHEARGLDVNPTTIQNFRRAKDTTSADMLETILADEVTHVEIGHRWFTYICEKRGKPKRDAFHSIVKTHFHGVLKPPFNEEARRAAGMEPDLYHGLEEKDTVN